MSILILVFMFCFASICNSQDLKPFDVPRLFAYATRDYPVLKEMDVSLDQHKKLMELFEEDFAARKKLRGIKLSEHNHSMAERIETILLPRQINRWHQIQSQLTAHYEETNGLGRSDTSFSLSPKELKSIRGVEKKLQPKFTELEAEFAKELLELKERFHMKQQALLEERDALIKESLEAKNWKEYFEKFGRPFYMAISDRLQRAPNWFPKKWQDFYRDQAKMREGKKYNSLDDAEKDGLKELNGLIEKNGR